MILPKDKLLHMIFCAIYAFIVSTITAHVATSPLPAIVAGVFGGVGKEFGDYRARGFTIV